MRENWIARVLSWVGVLIVGGVFGVAATIGHSVMIGWFPAGMVVGAIGCAAFLIAVRSLTRDRWATLAAGLGMLGTVVIVSGRGPGGSVLVQNDLLGQIWGYLVAGIALVVIAWPDLSRLPRTVIAGSDAAADETVSVRDETAPRS
ncbi:hypothetical protein GCM10025768_16210 [Microbacterium pseudoresistens]|uniref:Putative membrane protein YccC n=1 Tax=Microbacterium pseudoresistens TaxID=640634 RepID=A0A7Y9ES98_9MICO|nr:putative membrane protein YccC [Microbacterium pseudoresistens]